MTAKPQSPRLPLVSEEILLLIILGHSRAVGSRRTQSQEMTSMNW